MDMEMEMEMRWEGKERKGMEWKRKIWCMHVVELELRVAARMRWTGIVNSASLTYYLPLTTYLPLCISLSLSFSLSRVYILCNTSTSTSTSKLTNPLP